MKNIFGILLCSCCLLNAEFSLSADQSALPYKINKPDQVLVLPDTLHEISGLTILDSTTFACVQDENGILFIYDLSNNSIKNQFRFNIDGDYEGIAKVGKSIFVLRSDGTLFEIDDYESPAFKLTTYQTGIPASNNEGLCYDEKNHRLLIGCKGKIGKGPELKDKRAIYAFDLQTKKLGAKPIFDLNVQSLRVVIEEKGVKLKVKEKKDGQPTTPSLKFGTSAICIQPQTEVLYLLSAVDHLLFIFEMNGKLRHVESLDESTFNKSEGITFLSNGDMLITNEGQTKKPTLLRFNLLSE